MITLEKITGLEKELLQAMLKSDVETLDSLLAEDLLFTDHTGQIVNKAADIEAHRSGKVSIATIDPSEQRIQIYHDIAIVSVLLEIKGTYLNQPFQGKNRYTRVWMKVGDTLKIVAVHATPAIS